MFWKTTPRDSRRQPWLTTPGSGKARSPRRRRSLCPRGSRLNSPRRLFASVLCIATSPNIDCWCCLTPRTRRQVQSFGERIVLFILNVIIFGRLERKLDDDDMFFLPHSAKEQAKILWRDGAAVGFYTTKMKGSLCGDGTGACYLLPVFDTVFVRRRHRRQGLGVAMLQDFCETFGEEEALGISWPVSPAMYQVCRKFLCARPEERGRLWEVEPPGAWGQRGSIWLKVQLRQPRLLNSRPGLAKEDVSSHGRNSRDEGAAEPPDGESSKELISGDEPGRTKDDGARGVQEVRGAELDGQDAERTAVAVGLAGGSWPKRVRPSS
ncbi:protein FAM169B isoform X3 [Rousettus aegyptiacus]|uniref:protein FAM169B isoform X3 n=1 Tax=Rousettus aegyptiacus TaxID=9407 RepID=UPI00168D7999|nr:protein FAM169B isoform X3 [Rousettus aegyptiacus]XP_036087909.1 protein FAM169B isoform X3 [Rousettus aegyptiacus]XP_036087910.1 protein FAM169B isoform X3 [Rousettus aegyptiacus]XP_036087911.1 protein FAM169B isoform X3 [Rousettus aegyptiacus]XP_036087912.1 protein FAM169B isoform X3 [Rousettus aegyptiacus]